MFPLKVPRTAERLFRSFCVMLLQLRGPLPLPPFGVREDLPPRLRWLSCERLEVDVVSLPRKRPEETEFVAADMLFVGGQSSEVVWSTPRLGAVVRSYVNLIWTDVPDNAEVITAV